MTAPSGKTIEAWGLIGAGAASRSFLSRLPGVLSRLGPVKAASFQVARRLANSLRVGFAVSHYAALELCPVIWIFEPEVSLDRVIRDLTAQMPIHSHMVVMCETVRDSLYPSPLRTAGARIASLNAVDLSHEKLFVAEGHADTLRMLAHLLASERRRMVEIPPAAKPLYFAGIHLAKHLALPAISAAVESLRAAGFARAQATQVAEALITKAAASYAKAGPQAWNPGAGEELRKSLEMNRETLEESEPRVAAVYSESIRTALAYFGKA